jgi:F-type H+-transporting ATPase subunit delta
MRGISAEGYAESVERLEAVAADADAGTLGSELFAVADVLGREASVRRALTDPSAAGEAKSSLARALFGAKVADSTADVVATAAAARWSSTGDFVDAVEELGALALVIEAESADKLGDLEDELFRFGRVVSGDPELRDAITNKQVPAARRQELVRALLEGKASSSATNLAVQAVASRHRSFEAALESFQKLAADRQRRLVAVVRTAVELEPSERERLATALGSLYGRDVHLNVLVDPEVLGGIRVELGDDVIDGSIAGRLDDARRRMAG